MRACFAALLFLIPVAGGSTRSRFPELPHLNRREIVTTQLPEIRGKLHLRRSQAVIYRFAGPSSIVQCLHSLQCKQDTSQGSTGESNQDDFPREIPSKGGQVCSLDALWHGLRYNVQWYVQMSIIRSSMSRGDAD